MDHFNTLRKISKSELHLQLENSLTKYVIDEIAQILLLHSFFLRG